MKAPLLIGVTPLFWNSVPPVMPLILKCVVPKPAGGLMTMADDSVSSSVEVFETLAAARLPKF